jgi:flagellar motor switch protein FliN
VSWESLDWRPVDAESLPGTGALADLVPMARSAADEAVSAVIMRSVTTTGLSVASATGSDLPTGFVGAASFELLGTPRRGVWVALDPALGNRLGGVEVTADGLATAIIEAFDAVLVEIVGEGLSAGPADAIELDPAAELVLLRISLRDPDGTDVAIVTAVEALVPVELATHVAALHALGPTPSRVPSPARPAADARVPSAHIPGSPEPAGRASPARTSAPAGGATQEAGPTTTVRPFVLEELPPTSVAPATRNIELLMGVSLQVTVEIGRTRLAIRDVLSLTPGSIVELDKLAGEKVDVLVNGKPIAQGEVVVVDENFGVRITDVVSPQRRILSADSAA